MYDLQTIKQSTRWVNRDAKIWFWNEAKKCDREATKWEIQVDNVWNWDKFFEDLKADNELEYNARYYGNKNFPTVPSNKKQTKKEKQLIFIGAVMFR